MRKIEHEKKRREFQKHVSLIHRYNLIDVRGKLTTVSWPKSLIVYYSFGVWKCEQIKCSHALGLMTETSKPKQPKPMPKYHYCVGATP